MYNGYYFEKTFRIIYELYDLEIMVVFKYFFCEIKSIEKLHQNSEDIKSITWINTSKDLITSSFKIFLTGSVYGRCITYAFIV